MREYTITAGLERPLERQHGVIEKGTGQASMTEKGKYINRAADIGFPNRSECWGMRVIKDVEGKIIKKGQDVNVKDVSYKGDVIFLKWNHPDGQLILTRYLKGYNTLDLLYQNLVLNAEENFKEDKEASGDAAFIRLVSGDNTFDEDEDPSFVQMLKVHEYNESSISKTPNATFHLFREKKFEQTEDDNSKELSSKFDALRLVNEAAQDNTLNKLRNLLKIVQALLTTEVKDDNLFSALSKIADTKPNEFISAINEYKRVISDVFTKAKAFEILDLTTHGMIVAKDRNKQIEIAKDVPGGIPGKGDEMLDWCMSDFLSEKAFEISFQLKKITDKIK